MTMMGVIFSLKSHGRDTSSYVAGTGEAALSGKSRSAQRSQKLLWFSHQSLPHPEAGPVTFRVLHWMGSITGTFCGPVTPRYSIPFNMKLSPIFVLKWTAEMLVGCNGVIVQFELSEGLVVA